MNMDQFVQVARAIAPDTAISGSFELWYHPRLGDNQNSARYRLWCEKPRVSVESGTMEETLVLFESAVADQRTKDTIKARVEAAIEAEMQDIHDAEDARNRGIYLAGAK